MTTDSRTRTQFGGTTRRFETVVSALVSAVAAGFTAPSHGSVAALVIFALLATAPEAGRFVDRVRVVFARLAVAVVGLSLAWAPLDSWVRTAGIAAATGFAALALSTLGQARRTAAGPSGEPTLIVGEAEAVRHAAMLFSNYPKHNVRPVATATPDGLLPTVLPGASVEDVPLLLTRYGITHIMNVSSSVSEKLELVIGRSRPNGVRISVLNPLAEILTGKVEVVSVRGLPFVSLAPRRPAAGPSWAVKRTVDYVAAAVGLVVVSPVLALAALAVRLDSPGPVFFRQQRVGRNGRLFDVWKFRSMVQDAERQLVDLLDRNEAEGAYFKIENDPRVTRVGRWLRRLSIDELPQLFNVLRGEMSLVGPRPFLAAELVADPEAFEWRLPFLPGITGLWQIAGRSWLPRLEGLRMDLAYIEHWSPLLDLKILVRTLMVALNNDRRPPVNEPVVACGNDSAFLAEIHHDEPLVSSDIDADEVERRGLVGWWATRRAIGPSGAS